MGAVVYVAPAAAEMRKADEEIVTLFVGPEQVDCVGVAPQQCYQVRYAPDEDYQYFYSSIQGFTYTPGYEYELLVQKTPVANPPADGSSIRWTLVDVVMMTPVAVTSASPSRAEVCAVVTTMPDAGDTDALLTLLGTDREGVITDLEAMSANMQQYNDEGYGWQNVMDNPYSPAPQPGPWLIGALRLACEG
ncbi:DUF4377 domain-containing protein [Nodosilinea sp. LEGE 07088]|nr:DUF4377 domain-containing protein [Nodosilinea sp. LEGE 07088]